MRHEENGEAELVLDVLDQREDLRLHGDVERRDGFVGDEHIGLERKCARKADALALAAGEFVRIAVDRGG